VAIAHDSTTATTSGGKDVSGITFPHTVGAGSDRYLKVGVAINQIGPATVSSITYAGVAMTRLGGSVLSGVIRVEYWYLLNPPTGTNDVVVTLSDSPMNLACVASSYFGVNQTTPHGTESTATGVGTGPSVSVQSASGELVVDVMACADTGHVSVGSGQTLRGVADNGTTEAVCAVSDEAGATSVTMSHTIGAANDWAIIGVSLRPAVGGGRVANSLTAQWSLIARIANPVDLRWDMLARVSEGLDLRWDMLARVSEGLDLRWDMLARVSEGLDLRWDALVRAEDSLDLRWNSLIGVSDSLDLRWNSLIGVSDSLDLRWNSLIGVSDSLELRWDELVRVAQDLELSWGLEQIGRVAASKVLSWALLSRTERTGDFRWNVLTRVSDAIDMRWDVLARAMASRELLWELQGRIARTSTLRWDILEQVSREYALRWQILQGLLASRAVQWDIIARVARELGLSWDEIARMQRNLLLRWRVGDASIVPTGRVVVVDARRLSKIIRLDE